jgi:hypothetical protein
MDDEPAGERSVDAWDEDEVAVQRKDAHKNLMVDENGNAVMDAVQVVDPTQAVVKTLQDDVVGYGEHVCGDYGASAGGEERDDERRGKRRGEGPEPTEDGYSHSVTTVNYTFNGQGQLTGATGLDDEPAGERSVDAWDEDGRGSTQRRAQEFDGR